MPRAKKAPATDNVTAGNFKGRNEDQHPTREAELIPDPDDQLEEVDADSQGNTYLPGAKPLVSKRLKKLADETKAKRDLMISAKNDYVGTRDALIKEMQDKNIPEFELDTGEVARLTDKINVVIKKKKSTMSDIDTDELDVD